MHRSPYDTVAYPAHAYTYTHPDRLATVAALYGMQPAPLWRCRVLELGAGSGANLIPVAYQWPESEFVGIDLSSIAIARGKTATEAAGVRNLHLRHCDIMDIDAEVGHFDYIIAHGVFSWVSAPVRERMLSLIKECLTAQGVAFISYNSYPGSHLRNLTRDIMRYHVRALDDPHERVEQARAVLKAVSELSAPEDVYGQVLRGQFDRVCKMGDEVLFHDDLSDDHTAFLLSDVVDAAERHGLQYLSDATFKRSDLRHLSEPARRLLAEIPDSEFVAREQYQDFLEGHGFRRTLLCHSEIALNRSLQANCIDQFYLATDAMPENGTLDLCADEVTSFKIGRDGRLSTNHRLFKAALLQLGLCWPGTVTFTRLVSAALDQVGEAGDSIRTNLDEEVDELRNLLFSAIRGGLVELHLFPPRLTTALSERPRASRLARQEAETSTLVTNLMHGPVKLEDPAVRRFLRLVDGTRTVEQLVSDLRAELQRGDFAQSIEITAEAVERNLTQLARLGLLEA